MHTNSLNCWEFMKCGREPGGKKASDLGVCPASTFELTDGYLNGKFGGKACAYIFGDFCSESIKKSSGGKGKKACAACDFYNELKYRHREDFSLQSIIDYVEDNNEHGEALFDVKDGLIDHKQ